jgi:hypothetical protein
VDGIRLADRLVGEIDVVPSRMIVGPVAANVIRPPCGQHEQQQIAVGVGNGVQLGTATGIAVGLGTGVTLVRNLG